MSEAKGQQEPSMEEILASIRRIIAEDNDTGKPAEEEAAAPAPPPPPPPPPMAKHESEPEPEPMPEPMALKEDVLELTEIVDEDPEPAYEPPEPFQQRRFEMPPEPKEGLVSRATAAASTAAFAAMHSKVRERRSGDVYLGDGGITLEELVKELLRPQLQDWLDTHLAGIVERLVREEIERLARAAK